MKVIIINIVVTIVSGLLVLSFLRFFVTIDWIYVILSFAGSAIGSLSVDLFHWFRARRRHLEEHYEINNH